MDLLAAEASAEFEGCLVRSLDASELMSFDVADERPLGLEDVRAV